MKRILAIALTLVLLLSACTFPEFSGETTDTTAVPATTDTTLVPATTETTAPPVEETTLPAGYPPVEDVICYFNEVCLDAEFNDGGDPTLVQKWVAPISYRIYGEYTPEDLAVIRDFADWLNTIPDFPGMGEATAGEVENLAIYFCEGAEFVNILSQQHAGLDGGVIFWYNGEGQIYDAKICYKKDMEQPTRNSVILEELYNCLGPVQDTSLRPDSIIYADFSTPQCLTAMDRLILRLLYHCDITCGMDASQCEEQIRRLYPGVIGLE